MNCRVLALTSPLNTIIKLEAVSLKVAFCTQHLSPFNKSQFSQRFLSGMLRHTRNRLSLAEAHLEINRIPTFEGGWQCPVKAPQAVFTGTILHLFMHNFKLRKMSCT